MKVPFLDIKAQYAPLREEIAKAVDEVIDSGAFALGPTVAEFEEDFAEFVGARHCVGLNSGTSALHLALLSAGIGPGDEVVTTPHTWISTSWAISYTGATPTYADIDPDTGNLAPDSAERAITKRTKAILPVDLYGNPADHFRFESIAAEYGITLIDDAAQAHGASLRGRPIGSFGHATCWSFYPGKNLGAAGEGGAVVTDEPDVAEHIRYLRDHAQRGRHNHVELGFNARMDGIQGAILGIKLRYLEDWNSQRRVAADRYRELVGGIDGLTLPVTTDEAESAWHLYVVRVQKRDSLSAALTNAGVGHGVHYPKPVHLQPAYESLGYREGSMPNAELFASQCLSLPIFPEITAQEQEYVAKVITRAMWRAA